MNNPLYNQLCSKERLYIAWQRVKEKNTAGGVDRKTVEEYAWNIDKNLNNLLSRLQSGKYVQQPYKEIFIPKEKNEKRRLGLLTVDDKIVQTAVAELLNPYFEKEFLKVSYGYRPGKGAVKAVNKLRQLICQEKYCWLASCDIDNYFNTIPHNVLFRKLSAFINDSSIVELLKMFVCMGRVNNQMIWKDTHMGIPQGGIISPLLSNFYLHSLDKLITKNNYGYIRYADDFVLMGKTKTEATEALMCATDLITNELHLSLKEGSDDVSVSRGFDFLGITFVDNKILLSEYKVDRIIHKIKNASKTGSGFITPKFREVVQGVTKYYGKLLPQDILMNLDNKMMGVLSLKAEEMTPNKTQLNNIIREISQLEFNCKANNMNKLNYINSFFSNSDTIKGISEAKSVTQIKTNKAIAKRKFEYNKLAAKGFNIVLSTPGLLLGKKINCLTVKRQGRILQEVPLVNLKNITILSHGVALSSNAIQACAKHKISVDFLDYDGLPYAMLYTPEYIDNEVGLAQLGAYKNEQCYELVRRFIYGKISNQINLIKCYGKYHLKKNTLFKENYSRNIAILEKYAKSALSLERSDLEQFRQSMFGIEGLASSVYWDTIGFVIGMHVDFKSRVRQGASDIANCMLNYGYGILYSKISEAIIKAHLNPELSYLHKPEANRPSLVYDLIEEFRNQGVDRVVFAILANNNKLTIIYGQMDNKTRNIVVDKILARINSIEIFRGHEMRFGEIIQYQANSLAKYLTGKIKTYKPYIKKW